MNSNYLQLFASIHSIFRYLVLLMAFLSSLLAVVGLLKNTEFSQSLKRSALVLQIVCDIQLLLGLAVYYLGGHMLNIKNGVITASHYNRFYGLEHPLGMLLAIVLVHVGNKFAKKPMDRYRKHQRIFWCSFVALFIFVAQTPWPGKRDVGKPLFPAMSTSQPQ